MRLRRILLLLALSTMLMPFSDASAHHCANLPGSRHPTETEIQGGAPRGSCYRPTDRGIFGQATQAKQYLLQTRNACSSGEGITGENPQNCILKLNDDFAIKLAKLFQENPNGLFTGIKILSGYRTRDGEILVSGKDTGNHRSGCAVDLTGPQSSNRRCLKVCKYFIDNEAHTGLDIPYFYSPEYNHVEPASGCTGPGSTSTDTPPAPAPSPAPSASISAFARSLLAQAPKPPEVTPPPVPTLTALPQVVRDGIIPPPPQPAPVAAPVSSVSAAQELAKIAGVPVSPSGDVTSIPKTTITPRVVQTIPIGTPPPKDSSATVAPIPGFLPPEVAITMAQAAEVQARERGWLGTLWDRVVLSLTPFGWRSVEEIGL